MSTVSGRETLSCNWFDLESVKALAHKFGKGMSVIKYDAHPNYNIAHTSTLNEGRITRHGPFKIIYQT